MARHPKPETHSCEQAEIDLATMSRDVAEFLAEAQAHSLVAGTPAIRELVAIELERDDDLPLAGS